MKEAAFYSSKDSSKIQCQLCNHYCLIGPDKTGICRTRQNKSGVLYSLIYDKVFHGQVDPIEKKPLFHFLPGSYTYGVSTVGCNFRCQQCLNWSLSQADGRSVAILPDVRPEVIVRQAQLANCQSISFTYNEPTLNTEYNYEVMQLAHQQGLKNVWVSNGYMTAEVLKYLAPALDAVNIDLKAFTQKYYKTVCQARLQPILENLKLIKKLNIWLEVTTLIIPTLNDSVAELKAIAKFIFKELGTDTPWHVSKFSPKISWRLQHLSPTSEAKIKEAYQIGKQAGLKYVYGGNVQNTQLENTYCSVCNQLTIKRGFYNLERQDINGCCPKCGSGLDLILG
ncbi:MAG: AmmeMemoRadiSam system radical SAM enzyme [Patescibacteria group bacterium]